MKVELKKADKKDHFILFLEGKNITGVQEVSVFRHLIERIDNKINVGI